MARDTAPQLAPSPLNASQAPNRRQWRGAVVAVLVVVGVFVVQWGIASAWTFRWWLPDRELRWTTGYYTQLADAFVAGSPFLLTAPPAGLASLPDPYDVDARFPFNPMLDVTYYAGRYTLYFGPAPAVALALVQIVTGLRDIPDSALTFAAIGGFMLAVGAALAAARRLVAPGSSGAILGAAYVVIGLGLPMSWLLSRPAIYEAAIAAGQFGLVAGVACALRGWRHDRWGWWLAAGVAWAVAIGSRLSLAPAVVALAIGFVLVGPTGGVRFARRRAIAILLPLAITVGLLGAYNAARYGSPFETGHRYQLAGFDLHARYGEFFGARYLLPNVALLVGAPFRVTETFPFVGAGAPNASWLPDAMRVEPIVGLAVGTPFALLALAAPFGRSTRRVAVILLVAALAAALPNLLQRYSTLRYIADFAPLTLIVAYLGAVAVERWWRASPGRVVALVAPVTVWSVATGVLVAIGGRYDALPRHNPALAETLGMMRTATRLADGDLVANPIHAQFGDLAAVAAFRFEPEYARPGEPVWLTIWWRPGAQSLAVDGDARVVAQDFRPLAAAPVSLRPAAVADGVWQVSRTRLDLPSETPSPAYLRVELRLWPVGAPSQPALVAGGDRLTLGPLRVAAVSPWPPADAAPRELRFGNDLRLVGVMTRVEDSLGGDGPADWLNVTLFWAPSWSGGLRWERRTLTLEVIDAAGRVVTRSTGDPGDGWYSTAWWQPGDQITDEHWFELPPRLPAGEYRVRASMRWSNGESIARGDPIVATIRLP